MGQPLGFQPAGGESRHRLRARHPAKRGRHHRNDKIAAICETHFVGIVPHFTGPIATAALVNALGTFSGPVMMEYNFQGRTLPHLPVCLDFKNGKLYANDRPGLGVELDMSQLKQIAEITQPVTTRAQTYFRPDGSITNW